MPNEYRIVDGQPMNPYQFRISLRLRHPTMDLSFASAKFGLTPRRHWVHGAARTTMAGEPLEGTNDRSCWTAPLFGGEMLESRKQDLEKSLALAVEQLASHAEFLKSFRLSHGSTSLSIGIFGPKNFGIELAPQLLGELASLGIELGLDVYPGAPYE
jgi:hypothetical protein